MYTLGECLGVLVRDLNRARVIADIESANIAKMYSEHKLLKHFSIPRMKIQDTEITIPVAVYELEKYIEEEYESIDKEIFLDNMSRKIISSFHVSDEEQKKFLIVILKRSKDQFISEIDIFEKELKNSIDIKRSLSDLCKKTSSGSVELIKREQKGKKILKDTLAHLELNEEKFRNTLAEELILSLQDQIKLKKIEGKIKNAIVAIESDKLREMKTENLLYIKMKISEESMEWQVMEDNDGNIRTKLMAE
jgi:hypothetical protein